MNTRTVLAIIVTVVLLLSLLFGVGVAGWQSHKAWGDPVIETVVVAGTPKVVEKEVTKVVKETVEVEKIVKETIVVTATPTPTSCPECPECPTPEIQATQVLTYPLAGTTYQASIVATDTMGQSPELYRAVWHEFQPIGEEYDQHQQWWLFQPDLPTASQRLSHSVSFEILPGRYTAVAPECRIWVDEARKGLGSSGRLVVEWQSDVEFEVVTADGKKAWGLTECNGGAASGFSITWVPPIE